MDGSDVGDAEAAKWACYRGWPGGCMTVANVHISVRGAHTCNKPCSEATARCQHMHGPSAVGGSAPRLRQQQQCFDTAAAAPNEFDGPGPKCAHHITYTTQPKTLERS